ncbi:MAG: hypothetical protein WC057_09430 [Dehalococcoidales bacterium]
MATLTIYANSNHGQIQCYSSLYSQVTEGIGDKEWTGPNNITHRVGQNGNNGYTMYEYFSQYDLSSIDEAALILSVKEYLYLNYYSNNYSVSTVDESRIFDWTPPGGQDTYVKSDDLEGCTLLSSKTVDNTVGYHEFPSSDNFIAAVSSTSLLGVVHCSTRYRTKSTPSSGEFWAWYSTYQTGTDKDPKLVVEYATHGGGSESTVGISADGAGYQALYGGSESKVYIKAVGAGYSPNVLRFLQEPVVSIQNPVATHVIVTSPTSTYTAYITPEPAAADRIERAVTISEGNAAVCQAVAEALIARWGVEQITVTGRIPLTLTLDFKEYVYISIPFAGISQEMQLQSKIHTIGSSDTYTTVTLGSVYVGDNELIARILEEMG